MAFKSSVSDEEITDYLHKNVGDFRPSWEDLYYDMVGAGEFTRALGGFATITKPEAVKSMAQAYRKIRPNVKAQWLGEADTAFKAMIQGVRQLTDEILAPVKKMNLKSKLENDRWYGSWDPGAKEADASLNEITKRTRLDPTKGKNTIWHEIGHSKQWEQGLPKEVDNWTREIHMQLFADELEQQISKGGTGRLTNELIDNVYDNMLEAAKEMRAKNITVEKVIDFIGSKREERALLKQGTKDLDEALETLGGQMEPRLGLDLDEAIKKYKPGDMIDVPGVGKVKYDSAMEPFEGYGIYHQYTIQEGAAKGATIASKVPGFDELKRIATEKQKVFEEGKKKMQQLLDEGFEF